MVVNINSLPQVKLLRTSICYCDMVAFYTDLGVNLQILPQGSGIIVEQGVVKCKSQTKGQGVV